MVSRIINATIAVTKLQKKEILKYILRQYMVMVMEKIDSNVMLVIILL